MTKDKPCCANCMSRMRPRGSFKKPYCVHCQSEHFLKKVKKTDRCEYFRNKKEGFE